MMRFLFAFILLFPFFVFGQTDSLNQTDKSGLKQGVWKKHHKNGLLRYRGEFKDNKPTGTFRYFSDFGKKISVISYKGDTGFATFYHTNEKPLAKGIYINQKKEGTWKYWDNKELLSSIEEYNNGKIINIRKVFYANGAIAKEEPYREGLINGEVKEYFEDGKLKYSANYIDGNPDSTVYYYHPNGKNRIVGRYKDSVRHGKWTYYDEYQVITHREFYKLGELFKTVKREED